MVFVCLDVSCLREQRTHPPKHTHSHTHREKRERERGEKKKDESLSDGFRMKALFVQANGKQLNNQTHKQLIPKEKDMEWNSRQVSDGDRDTVEDIMSYFGEELKDKERAYEIMNYARKRLTDRNIQGSYFGLMNEIREILREHGIDVPFRAIYRRINK